MFPLNSFQRYAEMFTRTNAPGLISQVAIGVMAQPQTWALRPHRRTQRLAHQRRRHPGPHYIANYLTGEQILDARDIQPASAVGTGMMWVTQVSFGRVATNV